MTFQRACWKKEFVHDIPWAYRIWSTQDERVGPRSLHDRRTGSHDYPGSWQSGNLFGTGPGICVRLNGWGRFHGIVFAGNDIGLIFIIYAVCAAFAALRLERRTIYRVRARKELLNLEYITSRDECLVVYKTRGA